MIFSRVMCLLILLFGSAAHAANPFRKDVVVMVGDGQPWAVQGQQVVKQSAESQGMYYRLSFAAGQLRLRLGDAPQGETGKAFSRLEIHDVLVDGQRLPLFSWCLAHQSRHHRFLQQGLTVRDRICLVEAELGEFVINLNKAAWQRIKAAKRLSFVVKPYRTAIRIHYDMQGFDAAYARLAAKPVRTAGAEAPPPKPAVAVGGQQCRLAPPVNYPDIAPIAYRCGDEAARQRASAGMQQQVAKRARQARSTVSADKGQSPAVVKKTAVKTASATRVVAEAATTAGASNGSGVTESGVAENLAAQSELVTEITEKMVAMCSKYWEKGEHRCYCQKFIDHAPEAVRATASASCP